MPVRVEVLDEFFIKKDIGFIMPGKIHVFPNYTPSGEREILIFKQRKNSTVVYLANPDTDDVDIEENGVNAENSQKIKTLREGGESLVREAISKTGRSKMLRFSHVKIIFKRRLN